MTTKLLDREPTEEMLAAGSKAALMLATMPDDGTRYSCERAAYHAMWEVAPALPADPQASPSPQGASVQAESAAPTHTLIKELERAINCVSAENGSNTPDFILAEYLVSCLAAFNVASRQREAWYDVHLSPAQPETRDEVIEECAKACDERAQMQQEDHGPGQCHERSGALLCAYDLRALKSGEAAQPKAATTQAPGCASTRTVDHEDHPATVAAPDRADAVKQIENHPALKHLSKDEQVSFRRALHRAVEFQRKDVRTEGEKIAASADFIANCPLGDVPPAPQSGEVAESESLYQLTLQALDEMLRSPHYAARKHELTCARNAITILEEHVAHDASALLRLQRERDEALQKFADERKLSTAISRDCNETALERNALQAELTALKAQSGGEDGERYRAQRESAFQSHTQEQFAVRNTPMARATFYKSYDDVIDTARKSVPSAGREGEV